MVISIGKKEKIKDFCCIFLIYFGIFFLTFSQFLHYRVTSDHVPSFGVKYTFPSLSLRTLFSNGPFFFVGMFLNHLFYKIGQDDLLNTKLFQLFNIIVYALSACILHKILSKYITKKHFLFLGIIILFINPFLIESFVYHSFWWPIGTVFIGLSVLYLSRKNYIGCILFGYLAQQIYQINIFSILIICITVVYFNNYDKSITSIIVEEIKNCLICFIGPFLFIVQNTLYTKIYGAIAVQKDVLANQDTGIRVQRLIYSTYKLYISNALFFKSGTLGLFVLVAFIVSCLSIVLLCIKKRNYKEMILRILVLVLYFGSILLLSVIFYFLVNYSVYARVAIPITFAISMFAFIMSFSSCKSKNNFLICGSSIFLILFSGYLYYKTQTFITDSYIAQAQDEFVVRMIENKIDDYYNDTGIQITEIVTSRKECTPMYKEQYSKEYNCNHKIYFDEWAMGNYINLINNKNYKYRIMNEVEREMYFGKEKFTYFDLSKQLVFDGETAYWIAF